MGEVKKSCNNIDYIPAATLKEGPRSKTIAMLEKIPHNSGKTDIQLMLKRISKQSEKPVQANPKSALTLSNDELNRLIEYISENYKPLEVNAKKFISLDDKDNVGIIEKFRDLSGTDRESAKFLIENGFMQDKVYVAIEAIKREATLCQFSKMLSEDKPESAWQKWFEDCKWILGSDFAKILDDRSIDTESIADYLMQAYDGFVDIVEIKRPSLPFWAANKDHGNYIPSTELVKAITQCANYIHSIEEEANSIKFSERVGAKVIKPRCLLVFGKSDDWDSEKNEAFRILNASYSNLSIMTYTQLFNRAKNILTVERKEETTLDNDESGSFDFGPAELPIDFGEDNEIFDPLDEDQMPF